MKIIASIYFLWLISMIMAKGQISTGGGTSIVRPKSDWTTWLDESTAIVKSYRDCVKPPKNSKAILLLVAVQLGLNESVGEKGAALTEFAFVYSEFANDRGGLTRLITVMGRAPYLDRKWMTGLVDITEGREPLGNVLTLNDTVDNCKQFSEYAKRVFSSRGSKDYIISVIVFEKAFSDVFGKILDDGTIMDLTKHDGTKQN